MGECCHEKLGGNPCPSPCRTANLVSEMMNGKPLGFYSFETSSYIHCGSLLVCCMLSVRFQLPFLCQCSF